MPKKTGKLHSKDKGKRGELEVAAALREMGVEARRSAQYSGASGEAADVLTAIPWLHLEVKRKEALNLRAAFEQALRDAQANGCRKTPVVVHRSNRQPWMATLRFEDLISLVLLAGG